jgi:hypothetical protein
MNCATLASTFVSSSAQFSWGSPVGRWMRVAAAGCLVLALTHNSQCGTLVVYSFTGPTVGQTNNFTYNSAASDVTASMMTTHAMGTVGVVTNFLGAADNNSYSNFFDGKGFSAPSTILVDGGSAPEPTNNYVTFTVTPTFGHAVTITNVQVDFGLDDGTNNATGTQAQYDLFLSRNGTSFTRIGTTSTNSNVGKTYPGYTIQNNLNKAVTGFSNETGTITFRLAFADSNASTAQKRVFFDDVVASGTILPTVELQVDDAIAYERDTNLLAQFSFVRSDTNSPLTVYFSFAESNLTNGEATFGQDYRPSLTNLATFLPGEKKKDVLIRPVDDHQIEPPESITLTLLASSNYVVIEPTNGVAVLYDDDAPRMGICFRDTFDTPASSNNWTRLYAQNGGTNLETPLVVFGYDYVTAGIPPAPGITTNFGLKLGFTNASASVPAVVNLFHDLSNCVTDRYALSFDMYVQYDAADSLPQHAMAGINADPNKTNYVFQSPLTVDGSGQFVTLVGNDTTNTAIAGAQLWAPDYSTNVIQNFLPGSTMNQLLNNPPYGANGGRAGILGCDVNSTNKGWLHCELVQLKERVRLTINGYIALEANLTNAQSPFAAKGITPTPSSLSYGAIMLGYLRMYSASSPKYFVVFDNVSVVPLDGIALTSMALDSFNVYLNFYSQLSSDYNPYFFRILLTTNLSGPFEDSYAEIESINGSIAPKNGFFGAPFYNEFSTHSSGCFYQAMYTNTSSTSVRTLPVIQNAR